MVLDYLRGAAQRSILVTFANPATAQAVRRTPRLGQDLLAFDLVLPDGIGMCMAIRLLRGLRALRVSFDMTSLAHAIFEYARDENLSIVLVGGVAGVAERAGARLLARYRGLQIAGVFDGFGDQAAAITAILSLRPDILLCGMGAGQQEAFLLAARAQGWTGWGFTCGGFLDQLQRGLAYYPRWIDRINLRWAYRLTREPGRLWRRYLIDYTRFAWMVGLAWARRQ